MSSGLSVIGGEKQIESDMAGGTEFEFWKGRCFCLLSDVLFSARGFAAPRRGLKAWMSAPLLFWGGLQR